jgi:cell division protein FtsW
MPKKREMDYRILLCVILLVVFGLGMIYSSSSILAAERYGDPAFFIKKQFVWAIIGAFGMIAAARFDYRKLLSLAPWFYGITIVLLLLVMVPGIGREVSGARRWIAVGPLAFQPSEFAKLALIIFFSWFLVRKERTGKLKDFFSGFMPNALALGICFLLILSQPDLGTSLVIAAVIFTLFFVAGVRIRYLAGTFLLLMPFLYAAVLNVDYRRKRILAFLDPWADPQDTGFQIIQSYVALGNGHFFGLGLGDGRQKNFFLPDAHTDFIFSIIGEELGFVGCIVVVALFVALIYRGFAVAFRAPDSFGMYLALGITLCVGIQAAVNLGVATGLLPTKGLPLPFISFGGSALVTWMVSMGILLNVSEHTT